MYNKSPTAELNSGSDHEVLVAISSSLIPPSSSSSASHYVAAIFIAFFICVVIAAVYFYMRNKRYEEGREMIVNKCRIKWVVMNQVKVTVLSLL